MNYKHPVDYNEWLKTETFSMRCGVFSREFYKIITLFDTKHLMFDRRKHMSVIDYISAVGCLIMQSIREILMHNFRYKMNNIPHINDPYSKTVHHSIRERSSCQFAFMLHQKNIWYVLWDFLISPLVNNENSVASALTQMFDSENQAVDMILHECMQIQIGYKNRVIITLSVFVVNGNFLTKIKACKLLNIRYVRSYAQKWISSKWISSLLPKAQLSFAFCSTKKTFIVNKYDKHLTSMKTILLKKGYRVQLLYSNV